MESVEPQAVEADVCDFGELRLWGVGVWGVLGIRVSI